MILKLAATILFALISYAIGYHANLLLFGQKQARSGFANLLMGATGCIIILQPISFFFPLHVYWLLPAILLYGFKDLRASLVAELNAHLQHTSWQALCIAVLYLVYLLLPSLNADSVSYHIPSTEFFHDYPVITGLANVNEQVATNSTVFLLNAPFARLFGNEQGIYPVNTVFVIAFTIWLLRHPKFSGNNFTQLLRLGILVLCWRSWLTNLNSPSNDVLAGLLVLYVIIELLVPRAAFESTENKVPFLTVVSTFAITAKANCLPLALILPMYVLAVSPYHTWRKKIKLNWILPATLILAPWMARTYVMSGFLIYPFLRAPYLHPDFALPEIQSQLEHFFLTSAPKFLDRDVPPFQPVGLASWFPEWFLSQFTRHFNLAFSALLLALSSLIWVPLLQKRSIIPRPAFYVWTGMMVTIFVWLLMSPDYRFGYGWLASFLVILLYLPAVTTGMPSKHILTLAVGLMAAHYSHSGIRKTQSLASLQTEWFWRSPKTLHHYLDKCNHSARSEKLHNITLHPVVGDSICMQASPWLWRHPMQGLEARGSKITDGFRYPASPLFLQGVFADSLYNAKTGAFRYPANTRHPLVNW
ncbi:MAG: hypothetical protein MUF29_07455 [Chitinophagaceae bacterium]|nr:hypothetical protein [Chitinophagaceae bacterium]